MCSAVCFLAGRRKCCRMMILPPWQTAQLMNRRNEINHQTKPKKHKRLASSLRRTRILSPGYVCHSAHLYYEAWLVASCSGKMMTPRGGSGSFPVCQTRSLLSHHCRSCSYHPHYLELNKPSSSLGKREAESYPCCSLLHREMRIETSLKY